MKQNLASILLILVINIVTTFQGEAKERKVNTPESYTGGYSLEFRHYPKPMDANYEIITKEKQKKMTIEYEKIKVKKVRTVLGKGETMKRNEPQKITFQSYTKSGYKNTFRIQLYNSETKKRIDILRAHNNYAVLHIEKQFHPDELVYDDTYFNVSAPTPAPDNPLTAEYIVSWR